VSSWTEFLGLVDDALPDAEMMKSAKAFLEEAGFKTPAAAFGISEEKLSKHDKYPEELPVQAFLAHIVHCLDAMTETKRAAAGRLQAASPRARQMPQLPGGEAMASSALRLANTLAPLTTCDVKTTMDNAGLSKFPYIHTAEHHVFDILQAEADASKLASRQVFCYIDLTSKHILPIWLHPERIGGKLDFADDDMLDPSISTCSLASLCQALKSATEWARFFRTVSQWDSCYWRYASAAVALGHLTWLSAVMHCDVEPGGRARERERVAGRGPHLAFLYDELLRRQIEACSQSRPRP
jgi:hypothetical protein